MKILVVEDEAINRMMARIMLEVESHEPHMASTSVEAIDRMKNERFDLVLMDYDLPVMNGDEATRAIRNDKNGKNQRTPIIALSASLSPKIRDRCLAAGMNDYWVKPISIERLNAFLSGEEAPTSELLKLNEEYVAGLKAFDREAALTASDDDEEFLREMAAMFIEELPDNLAKLDESFANKEYALLATFAHKLAGSASNFGPNALSACAALLEEKANTRNEKDFLGAVFEATRANAMRLRMALEGLLAEKNPGRYAANETQEKTDGPASTKRWNI